ncbi:ATP-binding protein [Paenibacillus sp. FSL L8-0709]|uniref:ATP-binding protein n=1 Tax=Paenibacillus sp. FSL L8-0709 TaxID=2975312 RepID=UPI0030FCB7D7
MNEEYINLKGTHCMASYITQILPQNQGNPFIETLPNRLNEEEFIDVLHSVPPLINDYELLSIEDRLEFVQQIKPSFWLPYPAHYDKYRNLYTMIKIGYQSRNPMHAMYNRQFALGWDKIFKAGIDENGANLAGNVQTAQSHVEIAISGSGKSKVYERMLTQLFPQVIHHSEYNGRKLPYTQIVWMKIECPFNKSVGALCKNFYYEVDRLLGTDYYEKFGEKKGRLDTHARRMIKVATQINLGVLVIDEIQKIQKAYSGGEEDMIDFITELVNTIGVPTVLIGSYKALYLFNDSLANTRRGIPDEFSENITGYMLKDSWEWREFIHNLWDSQYTKTFTKMTEEILDTMYYHSMGIPDIAVKLFMHTQSRAIVSGGLETITVNLINEVAGRSLRLLQPIYQKIRNGDAEGYYQLEDIQPDWLPLRGYIQEASHRLKVYGNLAEQQQMALQQRNKSELLEKLTSFAFHIVKSRNVAETLSKQVFDASDGKGNVDNMFAELARLALDIKAPDHKEDLPISTGILPQQKKPRKRIKPVLEGKDIRYLVAVGHQRGMTTEEALEESGLVRGCDELNDFILSRGGIS